MKKNVYSIVLSEDIVNAVDRLAYMNGTNRSGMINRILAEYLSYETPEMKIKDIFQRIEKMLGVYENFKLLPDTTSTVMCLRSPIVYKYNPSVKYSIELYRSAANGGIGELRASLRTQNEALMDYFSEFCRAFTEVERRLGVTVPCEMGRGRFSRLISPRKNGYCKKARGSDKTVGDMIADYVYMFDNCLKAFFESRGDRNYYVNEIVRLYTDYLVNEAEII